jgi:hypothetical protein
MARASHRGPLAAALVVVCLAVAAVVLAGSTTYRHPVRLLQLNLCGSGKAACYTGRAVTEAAGVLRKVAPDVVTLNEVCAGDVPPLERALSAVHGGGIVSAFKPAPDRPAGRATRCLNGQDYGIALLAHLPERGHALYSGIYPIQDPGDPEERVWICLHAGSYAACTTHLASANADVALAQCRHLLGTTVPALHRRHGPKPTVVAGDLNLRYGVRPDLRPCLPDRYVRLGGDGLQHILATVDFPVRSSGSVDMRGATDHPGLLARFRLG